jgi:hypothetical protein
MVANYLAIVVIIGNMHIDFFGPWANHQNQKLPNLRDIGCVIPTKLIEVFWFHGVTPKMTVSGAAIVRNIKPSPSPVFPLSINQQDAITTK